MCSAGVGGAVYAFFNPTELVKVPAWVLGAVGVGVGGCVCAIVCVGACCLNRDMTIQEASKRALEEARKDYVQVGSDVKKATDRVVIVGDHLKTIAKENQASNESLKNGVNESTQTFANINLNLDRKATLLAAATQDLLATKNKATTQSTETSRLIDKKPLTSQQSHEQKSAQDHKHADLMDEVDEVSTDSD